MKITIYELLGMIKDGKAPKKIIYDGKIYEYQGDDYLYRDKDKKEHWLFSESYTKKQMWLDDFLNDEVEILEEDKIEKLDQTLNRFDIGNDYYRYIMENRFKINELIDEVNKLKVKNE